MNQQALQDIKVADFSWVGVGRTTTKYLADHGATVIRVESNHRFDGLRSSAPFKDGKKGINRSGYFALINCNKYSMAIDLNHETGREIAKKLIRWADVVAESFTPGRMEAWGLGYEDIKKLNEKVIMVRMNSHGLTGPYARQIGLGHQLVGISGFTYATGWPDREVAQPYGALTDWTTPKLFAAALLGALDYRRRTGKGQYLDCSQTEAALQFVAPYLLNYSINNEVEGRKGNASSDAAPHGVYRCQGDDRWIAITIFDNNQWQSLVEIMGEQSCVNNPLFTTLEKRKINEDELNEFIEKWTRNLNAEELMSQLQDVGIPASLVANARDIYENPQLNYRGHLWKGEHPELGKFSHLAQTFKLSRTPSEFRMSSPCLGEHTYFVCTEILGMSDEEVLDTMNTGALT